MEVEVGARDAVIVDHTEYARNVAVLPKRKGVLIVSPVRMAVA